MSLPASRPISATQQAALEAMRACRTAWRAALAAPDGAAAFLRAHTAAIDAVLRALWPESAPAGAALVAVGGYGRGEQFPYSDVDLLVLLEPEIDAGWVHDLLHPLWDTGLVIGHAVRTLDECGAAARDDVTVYTNLLDARLLCGDGALFAALVERVRSNDWAQDWSFFQAKTAEQALRYQAFDEVGEKIEPNIKESPGGLRDLHSLRWVCHRIAGAGTLDAMRAAGILGDAEWQALTTAEAFLSAVRIGLHALADRAEERLLLMHQKTLAAAFGYVDEANENRAVEQFMQRYFRNSLTIERLNQVLMQQLREQLDPHPNRRIVPINPRFQVRGAYLETTDAQVFMRTPTAILELFLLLAERPTLLGPSAATARQLRANLSVIDEGFRKNRQAQQLFLAIVQADRGVYRALKAMNLNGVLAAYLPAFGAIVGLMQFDLFHAFTVDAHTLLVVRNLRRFSRPEFAHEQPLASEIFTRVERPWVLYLAGLFHDIAKGRGGDHAVLGAVDARAFARQHRLSEADTERMAWLVEQHLLMSFTAQRRDIEDPAIIEVFARQVGSVARLDDLYLLTVADIRATHPNLWNSWRAALLRRLHQLSSVWLEQGERQTRNERQIILQTREESLAEGVRQALPAEALRAWLDRLPDDYFLRMDPEPIVRHATLALTNPLPLVSISAAPAQTATEILVIAPTSPGFFARLVAELDRNSLNVQSAHMTLLAGHPDGVDCALFEFFVLNQQNAAELDGWTRATLHDRLLQRIADPSTQVPRLRRRISPQMASLDVRTEIRIVPDTARGQTTVHISTKDRPGLLADLTATLAEQGLVLRHARISTLGERAEDVFDLVGRASQAVEPTQYEPLETALRHAILAGAE
ncbi:[protein-PII] uridylyltransferase [Halothiobacillus sp. DCM-1]|uniref:[protein-PII] uridylyltransferase n=1 Tax=Halothiobacillus sp. DCM-1 TaxID=3112558 RepID=UPI00324E016A